MSKRSVRRVAERKARQLARSAANVQPVETVAEPQPTIAAGANITLPQPAHVEPISEAQITANRANAKLSTGPTSPEGRAISSRNSLKHALTGSTVLLPTDDAGEYNRILDAQLSAFQPATEEEQNLIQSIVDSGWRISRVKRMETGIYLKGHSEFTNKFNDYPEFRRSQMIETETYLKYEKSLRNLQIQESRLYRRIEKDRVELARLQSARKREERLAAEQAPTAAAQVAPNNGFVFSTPQITLNPVPPAHLKEPEVISPRSVEPQSARPQIVKEATL